MPKTATNFKERVRALAKDLDIPYSEARNRLVNKATEVVVDQLMGGKWEPPTIKPEYRIDATTENILVLDGSDVVATFPYDAEDFEFDDSVSTEERLVAGILAAALGQNAFCYGCDGTGYSTDDDDPDEFEDDLQEQRCGFCGGTGYSVPAPLIDAAITADSEDLGIALLFPSAPGAEAGVPVATVADWLHNQTRMIQQEQRRDGVLPYPFFVLPGGRVLRQDFWRGKPWNLIGFVRDAEIHEIAASQAEFFEDPETVLGWHPVLADKDGNWMTYTGPIQSVDLIDDKG